MGMLLSVEWAMCARNGTWTIPIWSTVAFLTWITTNAVIRITIRMALGATFSHCHFEKHIVIKFRTALAIIKLAPFKWQSQSRLHDPRQLFLRHDPGLHWQLNVSLPNQVAVDACQHVATWSIQWGDHGGDRQLTWPRDTHKLSRHTSWAAHRVSMAAKKLREWCHGSCHLCLETKTRTQCVVERHYWALTLLSLPPIAHYIRILRRSNWPAAHSRSVLKLITPFIWNRWKSLYIPTMTSANMVMILRWSRLEK